ncbi:hypothetical protein B0H14DRAFT_2625149 [Mycena olivaceomarginata]|nr:hypothetical protein B0H14DRAFT_2625149 [Mycena olivaceomarginata]
MVTVLSRAMLTLERHQEGRWPFWELFRLVGGFSGICTEINSTLRQGIISSKMLCTHFRVFWVMQWQYIVAGSCGIEITAAGSIVTILFANIGPTGSIFDPRLTNRITVFFSAAVAQNIITTGLMSLRLWQREKRSAQYRTSRGVFIPILLILVESAGLYLFVETLLLTLYAVNYNAQFILLEAVTPLTVAEVVESERGIAMRSWKNRKCGVASYCCEHHQGDRGRRQLQEDDSSLNLYHSGTYVLFQPEKVKTWAPRVHFLELNGTSCKIIKFKQR